MGQATRILLRRLDLLEGLLRQVLRRLPEEQAARVVAASVNAAPTASALAYDCGRRAALAGCGSEACRIPRDDPRRPAWQEGWRAGAQERARSQARKAGPRLSLRDLRPKQWAAGAAAARAGEPRTANPYPTYRGGYQRAWWGGWESVRPS
jgi:hypothetical protein